MSRCARSSQVITITSSPTIRPSSAAAKSASITRDTSGAPSSACRGASARSVKRDSTLPIGRSVIVVIRKSSPEASGFLLLAGALHDQAGERQPLLAKVGHVDVTDDASVHQTPGAGKRSHRVL